MSNDWIVLLSVSMVGIGIGAALSRRNSIAILMSIATAGTGVFVIMAALDRQLGGVEKTDGSLFALCFVATLATSLVIGSVIAYRRFKSVGTNNVHEKNELRH